MNRRRRNRDEDEDPFWFLRDLFPGNDLSNISEQLDGAIERMIDMIMNSSEQHGQSKNHFVMGFRITQGPDGRPRIERLGSAPNAPILSKGDDREPLIDVLDDGEIIRVVAEMPGVSKSEISLHASEDSLLIEAKSAEKKLKYRKEVDLGTFVIPESAKAKFNNGVLEVELTRKEKEKSKGTVVAID